VKARAILKAKLTQLNSGIDPEIPQAGIMLTGLPLFVDNSTSCLQLMPVTPSPDQWSWIVMK